MRLTANLPGNLPLIFLNGLRFFLQNYGHESVPHFLADPVYSLYTAGRSFQRVQTRDLYPSEGPRDARQP